MIKWPFKKTPTVAEKPLHLKVGRAGEEIASRRLWRDGYRILDRNFQSRDAEIDIIAEKDRIVYFVEVKTRTEAADPDAAVEAVDEDKRRHIRRAARAYLNRFDTTGLETRYKVITVSLDGRLKPLSIKMFED